MGQAPGLGPSHNENMSVPISHVAQGAMHAMRPHDHCDDTSVTPIVPCKSYPPSPFEFKQNVYDIHY